MTGNDFAPFWRIIAALLALLLFTVVLACYLPTAMASKPGPTEMLSPEATDEPLTKPTAEPTPEPTPEPIPETTPEPAPTAAPAISTQAAYGPMAVSGDYTYIVNPDGVSATITGYTGNGGNITIPTTLGGYTVTAIGGEAFAYVENVISLVIGKGVLSIGASAFYRCNDLASISIPESVTSIDTEAFLQSYGLKTINVNAANANYTSLDGVLFNKTRTSLLQYPTGNTRTSYTIPGTVTNINSWAFSCSDLRSIVIPNSVTEIGQGAFGGCTGISSITIPGNVAIIGEGAFYWCTSLTTATLPASVTSIGEGAFKECFALTSINVAEGNNSYSSQNGVLFNKSKTQLLQYPLGSSAASYSVPNGVTIVKDQAFRGCRNLTSLSLPASLVEMDYHNFIDNFKLSTINVNGGNAVFCSLDGILFNKQKTELIRFPQNRAMGNYTIPNGVTTIGECAFYSCKLTGIEIPGSVVTIGDSGFFNCYNLISIRLPNGITTIEGQTFSRCYKLSDVVLPDSLTSIGSLAFVDCIKLSGISMPPNVDLIGYDAFRGCESLGWAYFTGNAPATVLNGAFDACASGFTVYYASGATGFTNPWHGYPTGVLNKLFLTTASVKNGISVDKAGGLLTGVADGTSVSVLKAQLINDGATIKVYNSGGQEYTGNAVGTGMTVRLVVNGSILDELRILVRGDVNGDGQISVADYALSRLDILKLKGLTGIYATAGDVNRDGKRNVTDYTSIRLDILNLQKIHG
jgi:hypothetical protein